MGGAIHSLVHLHFRPGSSVRSTMIVTDSTLSEKQPCQYTIMQG